MNEFVDTAEMTSDGKLFQSLMTRLENVLMRLNFVGLLLTILCPCLKRLGREEIIFVHIYFAGDDFVYKDHPTM